MVGDKLQKITKCISDKDKHHLVHVFPGLRCKMYFLLQIADKEFEPYSLKINKSVMHSQSKPQTKWISSFTWNPIVSGLDSDICKQQRASRVFSFLAFFQQRSRLCG